MKQLLLAIGLLGSSAAQAQNWHWGVQAGGIFSTSKLQLLREKIQPVDFYGQPVGEPAARPSNYRYETSGRAGASLGLVATYVRDEHWQFGAGLRAVYQPVAVREVYDHQSGLMEYQWVKLDGTGSDGRPKTYNFIVGMAALSPTRYHYHTLALELPVQARYYAGRHWGVMASLGPRLLLKQAVRVSRPAPAMGKGNNLVFVEQAEKKSEPFMKTLAAVGSAGVLFRLNERYELNLSAAATLGSIVDTRNLEQDQKAWDYVERPLTPNRVRLLSAELGLTRWLR